jgi:catechol 2,3-dioxygenase-like lactoylglutathione lyase family enzyme
MSITVGSITVDCTDVGSMTAFWAAALGATVQMAGADFGMLARPENGGPYLSFQRVPEPKAGKNRLHVNLSGEPRATAVPRLEELGATAIAEHRSPGIAWTVMADPEGNEFCVGEAAP